MQTVLAKIVADKAIWVEARKQQQPLASFQNDVVPSSRRFYDALQGARTAFILECKKASPSKGVIRDDFDPARIAGIYKHHASAISVLTDEKYFQGSFDFLPIVSGIAPQPILCKDFIIDPYQIWLARFYQADACLLMLSVLDDEQYRQLSAVAHSLKMGVLTEVSNEEELERAIALEAKVVGINNRDLRDLSIDLNRTRQLARAVQVNGQVTQIAVVNADHFGFQRNRALQLLFVAHFGQHAHFQAVRDGRELAVLLVVKHREHQQAGVGLVKARQPNLIRIDNEVFTEDRLRRDAADDRQKIEAALKIFLIRQHGDG